MLTHPANGISMACRDENISGPNFTTVVRDLRLERIAVVWEIRCTNKYNQWVKKYNRRMKQITAQTEAKKAFANKVRAWKKECNAIGHKLDDLLNKMRSGGDVTPADWDAIAEGNERKVLTVVAPRYPVRDWPRSVPYPNLIAFKLWLEDEMKRTRVYTKRYHSIIQIIAQCGATTVDSRRIAECSTSGVLWEKSLTPEHIRRLTVLLHFEERLEIKSAATWTQALCSKVAMALRGHQVLGRDWNAYVFARALLQHIGEVSNEATKKGVVLMIEDLVARWHDKIGHSANLHKEWLEEGVVLPDESDIYRPYDGPNPNISVYDLYDSDESDLDADVASGLDEDVESDSDQDTDIDQNIDCENELSQEMDVD